MGLFAARDLDMDLLLTADLMGSADSCTCPTCISDVSKHLMPHSYEDQLKSVQESHFFLVLLQTARGLLFLK